MEKTDVSVIIPVKDEEQNIHLVARELTGVFESCSWSWECIWVDDGSRDRTLAQIERLHERDPRMRLISFERNEGQSAALWAGFQEARGDVMATLDGDGQNDPSDLPSLIEMVQSGTADMVNGFRARRRDTLWRRLASLTANGFRNRITGRTVRDVGCSTRAFRKECVSCLPLFRGMHRFFPTLVNMQGFRITEVPVNHRPRLRGQTKYSTGNRLWVGLFDLFGVYWLRKRGFLTRTPRKR